MDPRDATILLHAVETYIRTGRPAGSRLLQEETGLALSSATIRAVLHQLDAAGFLHQPHTSAGRIPTDRGYRFYVDHQTQSRRAGTARLRQAYRQASRRHSEPASALAHAVAEQTRAYVIAGTMPRGEVAHTGMSYLIDDATAERLAVLQELSACIDRADELIQHLAAQGEATTRVYIGQENPFIPAAHTSLLVRTIAGPAGRTTVLTIIGPKRMPYQHYVRVLNDASDLL